MIFPKFRFGVRRTISGPFYPVLVHLTPQTETLAKTLGLVESTYAPTNFNKPFFYIFANATQARAEKRS